MDTLQINPSHLILGIRARPYQIEAKRMILSIVSGILLLVLVATYDYEYLKRRRDQVKKELQIKRTPRRKNDSL